MSVRQATPSGVIAEMPSGTLDGPRVTQLRLTAITTTIDLTGTTFVKPGGVTTLAAMIDAFCRTGRTLHVIAPSDYGAYNYLARIHFSHFLEELGCTHTFPSVRENDLGHDLVPLTRVASGHDANALGAAALNFAGAYDEGAAQALCRAIGEAGENVSFHSGSPAGFIAAQRFPANGHFEFAVADAGYGLLHTLQAHGASNHASAIELALTEGVSATGEANRGFGLSSIEASVASALSGSLSLLSGDTLTHATASGRRATTIDFPYQGTVVYARFRGHRGRRRG